MVELFYRYIQWGNALGKDNQAVLQNYIDSVFQNKNVTNKMKRNFCNRFMAAYKFNEHFYQGSTENDIFLDLFGSNSLKPIIEELASS